MNTRSGRILPASAALAAAIALAIVGARAQSPAQNATPPQVGQQQVGAGQGAGTGQGMGGAQGAAATPVKKAPEVFKNIQVLKDMNADQLQPAMQFIAASLGVGCNECHVEENGRLEAEKDDKNAKGTARRMMQMTMDINKNSFGGRTQVTCFSCHRGSTNPVGVPIISDVETPRAEPPAQGSMPTADQILDKYVQAVGGADAIARIHTRIEKGNILLTTGPQGPTQIPTEIYAKAPNMRLSITHQQNGENYTAFDGTAGWMTQRQGPAPMSAADSANYAVDSDFALPLDLQQKKLYKQIRMSRPEKIGDKEYYVLQAAQAGLPRIKLYFDEQTGLLARLVRMQDVGIGYLPVQLDYSDYRDADGIKLPFRWTLARVSNRFTTQIDSVQQNVPIDDAKFARPAAAPGQE
jgi:photosynthetic reaction center cytochrome c subunit